MSFVKRTVAWGLAALLITNLVAPALACGPSSIEPIFVFETSPDVPFAEFTAGKIGIVKPTFGRKTLTIAFRYLNGGSFTSDEQKALVTALHGKAVEREAVDPVKTWISTRKEFATEADKLPEIYVEQRYGGYDFFPNCTANAFEVATETLRARVASYGADDKNVRAWLSTQDTVFQNCSAGGKIPATLGEESPEWLRKDRDYQIAAAHFYSLHFEQAQTRFAAIAADAESPWQQTADYLVGRTLVRHASLSQNETQRNEIYKQAELYLQGLQVRSLKFARATQRLMALVKYRLHPEERVGELARILAHQTGNDNVGQDLIDYVWLVDKFEAQVLKEQEQKRDALKAADQREREQADKERNDYYLKLQKERSEHLEKGETLEITIYPKQKDGQPDYTERVMLEVKHDVSEADVLQAFELKLGRKLSANEEKQAREAHAAALEYRQHNISPNRKWDRYRHSEYEGYGYGFERLKFDSIPKPLLAEELTDWIMTFQSSDPRSYAHALSKWRDAKSPAWLAATLAKADKTSPRIKLVMREAEKVERDSPAFPTIAYHLVRLKTSLGLQLQARTLLDDIISWQAENLPVSAQNQFLEQRMRLAKTLDEFLQFSARRPATFYEDGRYGKISEFLERAKQYWDPRYSQQTREEFEQELEESYRTMLPWDNQLTLDDQTVDLINWHFPTGIMAKISRHPSFPAHLQRRFLLAALTRAIVLKQSAIAQQIAPEVLKAVPEMESVLQPYLDARNEPERSNAALYVLLKFPDLSPFLGGAVTSFQTVEDNEYYLETAWWCTPSDKEYNYQGDEVRKVVAKPLFLSPTQLEAARRERAAIIALGHAKDYLGKQAVAWANKAPDDPRVPEALYITARANLSFKYGCTSWEADNKSRIQAEALLRTKYPRSLWTAKLSATEN